MERCDHCGNAYDKTFRVISRDEEHVFDSFECAIAMMAPRCVTCSVRIIGHGLEADGVFYCCANCARRAGEDDLKDRESH